jgi:ABC-2 type transport system ATP-binding protein
MDKPIISVNNFRKVYGEQIAVDNVSFEVQPGEIFGLLGPNGAGKTTILESLEGLRRPDEGVLQVAGVDPTRQAHKLRDVIGVQLQTSGLPETIRVDEAMNLFSAYHQVPPRTDLLDRLGLGAKRQDQYHQLSTGQQRRLALALAILHNPSVVFLDEPSAGLDVPARAELHDLIRELQADGTTIILATHDMAEAETMTDQVAILLHGRMAATGTPLEITATGSGLTKISVHTQNGCLDLPGLTFPAVQHQAAVEGYRIYFSTDIGSTVGALIAQIETQGDALIDLRVERPSLEDRFLEITTNGDSR